MKLKVVNKKKFVKSILVMEYEIVRWYDERRTVTRVQGFESAVSEYNKTDVVDTVQLYLKYNGMTILLAQKEC